jgi:hypothetical protein
MSHCGPMLESFRGHPPFTLGCGAWGQARVFIEWDKKACAIKSHKGIVSVPRRLADQDRSAFDGLDFHATGQVGAVIAWKPWPDDGRADGAPRDRQHGKRAPISFGHQLAHFVKVALGHGFGRCGPHILFVLGDGCGFHVRGVLGFVGGRYDL